jgi:hypothetical protein
VVAGVGVDDASASGCDAIEAALIDWLKECENGAGSLYSIPQCKPCPEKYPVGLSVCRVAQSWNLGDVVMRRIDKYCRCAR